MLNTLQNILTLSEYPGTLVDMMTRSLTGHLSNPLQCIQGVFTWR
jgi:hypothetical protein